MWLTGKGEVLQLLLLRSCRNNRERIITGSRIVPPEVGSGVDWRTLETGSGRGDWARLGGNDADGSQAHFRSGNFRYSFVLDGGSGNLNVFLLLELLDSRFQLKPRTTMKSLSTLAQSVKHNELRSLKELQLSRREFDSRSRHKS